MSITLNHLRTREADMDAKVNLTVGRSTTVHVAYGDLPRCDTGTGARGGTSRKTTAPVTCKRCLKIVPTANDAPNA